MPAAAVYVRPARAADPWALAEFYQLSEPPADPARLPGWLAQVRRTGYCSHPVRLAGRVDHADLATGEVREFYTTDTEPSGVLLKACGNRRASVCPACAETYRRATPGSSSPQASEAAKAPPARSACIRGCS